MNVPGKFYVNEHLQKLMFEELEQYVSHGDVGGFLPAVKQLANVAALPGAFQELWCSCKRGGFVESDGSMPCSISGIVGSSIGLPDIHSGYGFAIGNVAAFDMNDPKAIVSPGARTFLSPLLLSLDRAASSVRPTSTTGGVGFDINCGVRLLRTNLTEKDVKEARMIEGTSASPRTAFGCSCVRHFQLSPGGRGFALTGARAARSVSL